MSNALDVQTVPTTPFDGQKPGTSGLRKKTKVFMEPHYLANFVQSTFDALPAAELSGATLVVSGDGRFYNDTAVQVIVKMAAANNVGKLIVGAGALMATPALSTAVRGRGAYGGIILTASHNPGGPEEDFGIKYNVQNGGPAPQSVTDQIFENTKTIQSYKICNNIPDIDLSVKKTHTFTGGDGGSNRFKVEVVDPVDDYLALMKTVFDFDLLKQLMNRADFHFVYDALNGIAGPYATRIFGEELGVPEDCLMNCTPLPDFGGLHPDPNLTYAKQLVEMMGLNRDGTPMDLDTPAIPDFGAAADGDADRNMILGRQFFVTPSDSVAMIAAHAPQCIPYFKDGIKSVARSMPTSQALDLVAKELGIKCFEVPTGWKFFGNLMDAALLGKDDLCPLICGEESFGTGASHIREKDGPWAVLCWLSILAKANETTPGGSLVTVQDTATAHWKKYGRNYYCRYDYEGVGAKGANDMMDAMRETIDTFEATGKFPITINTGDFSVEKVDDFSYEDPIDGSVTKRQGIRFIFTDGSRIIFRLSGTGSVGATVRLYLEKYELPSGNVTGMPASALGPLVAVALNISQLEKFTGRTEPTVIT
jgi:phosphoglucomutase